MARPIRRRAALRRFVVAWSIAALLVILSLSTASAHAVPVRSEPSEGETLTEAPREIRVWFNEPILPRATQARLLDSGGSPLQGTQVQFDSAVPTLMIVEVPELGEGIYNLAYSTISTADGHPTQGHLVFGVRTGSTAEGDLAAAAGPAVQPEEAALRGLNFLALAALTGAIAVAFLLLRARTPRDGSRVRSPEVETEVVAMLGRARGRVLLWALVSALVALFLGIALLSWQARVLSLPGEAGANASTSALEQMVWLASQTPSGHLWIVRQILLLAIAGLLGIWLSQSRRPNIGGFKFPVRAGVIPGFLSVAVLVIQARSGHAAAVTPDTTLSVLASSVHLVAASLWVGGLLALAIGLLPLMLSKRAQSIYATLARAGWGPFGLVAASSVGVMIVTGLYMAGREVASLDALLTTFYGHTLTIKLLVVLGVGFIGLLNAIMLHPRLTAPLARFLSRPVGWKPLSLKRLPVLVLAESAAGIVVLLATGVLTSLPTANGPEFAPPPPPVSPVTAPSQLADDLLVTFEARPNVPGQNVMLIQAVSLRRPPPAEIMRVIVHTTFLGQDIGTVSADAQQISPGLYQLAGDQLSLAGPWHIEVAVRRKGLEDSKARFDWTVPPAVVPRRTLVVSNRPLEPILTAAAASLAAFLAGVVVLVVAGRAIREITTRGWNRNRINISGARKI